MNKYGLVARYVKKLRKRTFQKFYNKNIKPNLVKREFNVDKETKVWLTDITCFILKGKRFYLSTILNLYDRKVITYKMSKFNNLSLVLDTLNPAIDLTKNTKGIIIHSDQGFQYTSHEYFAICEANGMRISMSRKGMPIDNSPMESFHSILKKETLYNNNYESINQLKKDVEEWIYSYNTKRIKLKNRQ